MKILKSAIFFFLASWFATNIYAQSINSCVNARSITADTSGQLQEEAIKQQAWFIFTATNEQMHFITEDLQNTAEDITLYSGSCGELVALARQSTSAPYDTLAYNNFVPGQQYYVRIQASNGKQHAKIGILLKPMACFYEVVWDGPICAEQPVQFTVQRIYPYPLNCPSPWGNIDEFNNNYLKLVFYDKSGNIIGDVTGKSNEDLVFTFYNGNVSYVEVYSYFEGIGEKFLVSAYIKDAFGYTQAGFTWSPDPVCVDQQPITFTSTSTDEVLNLNNDNYKHFWDMGDGRTYEWQPGGQHINPTEFDHTYDNPGTYNVTLRVENPCYSNTITQTVVVQENNAPVVQAIDDQCFFPQSSNCLQIPMSDPDNDALAVTSNIGTVTKVFGITTFYRFCWTPGLSDVGDHTVTITASDDHLVCEKTDAVSFNVTVNEDISSTIQVDTENPLCYGGSDGAVTVTEPNGNFLYSLDGINTQSSRTFTGLPAGIHTAYVHSSSGCVLGNKNFTLSNPDELLLTATVNQHVKCPGGSDAIVTLTASGGTGTGTYEFNTIPPFGPWTSSTTNSVEFEDLNAGTHSFGVRDDASTNPSQTCEAQTQVQVTEPDPISTSIALLTPPTCPGSGDGEIIIAAIGGTPPYLYALADNPNNTQATGKFTGLSAGNYTIIITDNNNCTRSFSYGLIGQGMNTVNHPQHIVCSRCMIFRLADLGVPLNYGVEWYKGKCDGSGNPQLLSTSDNFCMNAMPGDYYALATDPASGCVEKHCFPLLLSRPDGALCQNYNACCIPTGGAGLVISPNPGNSRVTVTYDNAGGISGELRATSVSTGQPAGKWQLNMQTDKQNIDVSAWPPGLYDFVYLKDNQLSGRERLTIMRH